MSARSLVATIACLVSAVSEAVDDGATDGGLVTALEAMGELRRRVDALGVALTVRCAGYRSGDGDPLPARTGMRDLASLLTFRAGLDPAESSAWVELADATRPRTDLSGVPLPARRPAVAGALAAGELPIAGARTICTTIDDVAVAADLAAAAELETTLVRHAPHLLPRELRLLCRSALDRCTPELADAREQVLRARSGLRVARLEDGSARWTLTLDAESEGVLRTALDARTAPRRSPSFAPTPAAAPDSAEIAAESLPLHRRRLDALVDIARASLSHDEGVVAGSPVTMVVTVDLEALRTGLGTAGIAGVDEPISAGTARRLAADAEIVPVVLGSVGAPLDVGRSHRVATPAQRRALAVRDRGCARCGSPPGWCEVAHLVPWWEGGRTDLGNLVLLCPPCHRSFDREGWRLVRRDGVPWFIPPPHIDATRAPRRGFGLPRTS